MNAENLFLSCDSERAERPASGPCYGSLDLRLGDCMDLMRRYADKHFDLAIVDPPYGIGQHGGHSNTQHTVRAAWDNETPPSFASCELAWTSYDRNAATWSGKTGNEVPVVDRIHPTQKPVALYRWLLANYAKPGQRILDTHLGSGSHAIAAHYFGAHLTACEIDADYYAAAVERVERETQQLSLFQ